MAGYIDTRHDWRRGDAFERVMDRDFLLGINRFDCRKNSPDGFVAI